MKIHKQSVYVELDSLLDTRLTVLQELNSTLANKVLTNKSYHRRETDFIDGFNYDQFLARHKEYDVEVLKKSFLSNLVFVLKEFSLSLQIESAKTNVPMRYEFEINYYPYKLTIEEVEEIKNCLEVHLPLPNTIVMINIPNEQLTPIFCKERYVKMFMYRYYEWFDMHFTAFQECLSPGLIVYGPAIRFVEEVSNEDKQLIDKEGISPMKFLMLSLSPMLCLKLIDARIYSVIGNLE